MASPATTGGRPISALAITTTPARPGNRASASTAPRGRPTRAAMRSAVSVTRSDRRTISTSTGSPFQIIDSAKPKALMSLMCPLQARQR